MDTNARGVGGGAFASRYEYSLSRFARAGSRTDMADPSRSVGLVRAPLFTTLMQVASRFLLVWGIVNNFPVWTGRSTAYSTMLIAWSVTEVIRYSYFAVNLAYGSVPDFLTWLRYNTFFVLYPLGISSECWLVYQAIAPAKTWNAAYEWVLKLIIFVYIPGMFRHGSSTEIDGY